MKPCDRYLNAINELVDGTLGPIRRAELEMHLESCDACRALAEDLQAIADSALALDTIEPPARVWQAIATELQRDGRVAPPRPSVFANRRWLALAATLTLAVAGSLVAIFPRQRATPVVATVAPDTAPGNAVEDDPVKSATADLARSGEQWQKALDELAQRMDPETQAVIKKEVATINQAHDNIVKVIEQNPDDSVARQSLYDLLKQRIRFVQNTIALMNEMRQGDAAGAAQIVDPGKS